MNVEYFKEIKQQKHWIIFLKNSFEYFILDFLITYTNIPIIYLKHYCKNTLKHFNIDLIYQADVKYGGLLLVSQWQQHNCHGLGYFGILWAMSCPRIFWDTFDNIMA
jgi:hypothetical protein